MRVYVVLVLTLLGYHTESSSFPYELKTYTLEELIPLRAEFFPDRLTVQWTSDTEYIFSEPSLGIKKHDAATDRSVTILDVNQLLNLSQYSVSSFSNDEKYLLLATNRRKIYRYSSTAEFSVFDLETNNTVIPLDREPLQAVVWGAERSLAYVKRNNVYYVPDCSRPDVVTPLTVDGVPGEVYYGVTDWIYEEEIFNAAEALWFSPRGTYLAVASFNDSQVESAVYPYYGLPGDLNFQYTHEVRFKYTKAGRANPVVGLRVFKPDDPNTDAWNIPAPVDVVGPDHILARVNWVKEHSLLVLWMNRRQNTSALVYCNLLEDKCHIVKKHSEPHGWIDIPDPFFNKDGNQIVEIQPQTFEGKRYMHAALYDLNTHKERDLTPGNSTVTEILTWNQELDLLYYIQSPEDKPWLRQLWVSEAGDQRCVTCNEPSCHSVNAMMSPGGSYGVITCSTSNIPPKMFFYKRITTEPSHLKLIKDNNRLVDRLSKYKNPMLLFNKISLAPNVWAHVRLQLPPGIKKDEQLPMVIRVYAGPGTARVWDAWDLEYYNLYLSTNRSFIVASIDVRGSSAMGVEALHAVNNALGTVEVTDTLDAIRKLTELYKFIDPKKVGVWGWSYGGFATTMMLILDKSHTVTCGAAVAPVTSWLYYDSIYTERYMDTPANNPLGYKHSDLMLSAEKLRGRKYLLVHGTGDDNVHYQHSLQLAKVLQHSDIAFEQMSYTDESHSLLGVSRHFYHTLDRFWTDCFYS